VIIMGGTVPDWYPSEHTYTGDADGRLVKPHYATMPDRIRVYDTAVRNSGWQRWQKRLWRKARNNGLSRWSYPYEAVEAGSLEDYSPEGITLRPYVPDPNYGANSYGGFGLAPIEHPERSEYDEPTWNAGKGFALITPIEVSKAFDTRVTGRLAGVICHEVGHALGFGHGGSGIMRSAIDPPYYPNIEEIAALKDYWGLP
jgi:hypothetical protein